MNSKQVLLNTFKDNRNLEITAKDLRSFVEAIYDESLLQDNLEITIANTKKPISASAVYELAEIVQSDQLDIRDLQDISTGLGEDVTLNIQEIEDANTRISDLDTLVGVTQVDINTNHVAIDKVAGDLMTTDTKVTDLDTKVQDATQRADQVQANLKQAQLQIDHNTNSTQTATNNIAILQTEGVHLSKRIAKNRTDIDTIGNQVQDNQADIANGTNQMQQAMVRFNTVETEHKKNVQDIKNGQHDLNQLRNDLTTTDAHVGDNKQQLQAHNTIILNHSNDIAILKKTKDLSGRVSKLEGQVSTGFDRVHDMELLVTTMDVTLKDNSTNIATQGTNLGSVIASSADMNTRLTKSERELTKNITDTQTNASDIISLEALTKNLDTNQKQLTQDVQTLDQSVQAVDAWKNTADAKLVTHNADIKKLEKYKTGNVKDITQIQQDLIDHNNKLAGTIQDVVANSQAIVVNANNIRINQNEIKAVQKGQTPLGIKTAYESNLDTNVLNDKEKAILTLMESTPGMIKLKDSVTIGSPTKDDPVLDILGTVTSSSWINFNDSDINGQIARSARLGYEAGSKDFIIRNTMNGGDIVLEPSDPNGKVFIRIGNKKHELFANKDVFVDLPDELKIGKSEVTIGAPTKDAILRLFADQGKDTAIVSKNNGTKDWEIGRYTASTVHPDDLVLSNSLATGGFIFRTEKTSEPLRTMDSKHVFHNIVTSKTIDKLEAQAKPADIVANADFAKAYNDLLALLQTAGILA